MYTLINIYLTFRKLSDKINFEMGECLESRVLKKRQFNIFNTFDVFNCEAIDILRERIIKFVLIEADNFFMPKLQKKTDIWGQKILQPVTIPSNVTDSCISAEMTNNDTIYFSVLNNKRMYYLLTNSWRRYKSRLENEKVAKPPSIC
jgi:hypothetical protein